MTLQYLSKSGAAGAIDCRRALIIPPSRAGIVKTHMRALRERARMQPCETALLLEGENALFLPREVG
jgi:hypothetical protein